MNCKPGDLAVLVRSSAGNEGRIVRVLRRSHWNALSLPDGSLEPGIVWECDSMFPIWDGTSHPYALDHCLRPIRDPGEDARDETLDWLPVPTEEMA